MARRSEHSQEEIKAMVLQAAQSIIDEEGPAALKVRRVAREIGYTVGSIYMLYANMDDLILHVKDKTLVELALQLDKAIARPQAAEQSVLELASVYVNFAGRQYNRWSMVFTRRLPGGGNLPEWYRQRENGIGARFEKAFSAIAPHRQDDDNSRAAQALWGGVHGNCLLSLSEKSDTEAIRDVELSVRLLVRNYIHGWLSRSEQAGYE